MMFITKVTFPPRGAPIIPCDGSILSSRGEPDKLCNFVIVVMLGFCSKI